MERLGDWALDPGVSFLNHGSFGARLRSVLDRQRDLRDELESNPVAFIRSLDGRMASAREVLGRFLDADPDDLGFVPNATHGIATILRSFPLRPGDEILAFDHEYNAALNAARAAVAAVGARLVVVPVPLPVRGPEAFVAGMAGAAGPRTRLVLVSHVTSPTALVLPVNELVGTFEARGIPVLVDGAHAPGMLPVSLRDIGASYYTGNLHKWVAAPLGAAFLHVRRDRQPGIRPLAISHGANDPRRDRTAFRLEFDWTGTADPTPFLSVPAAIDAVGALLPGGWDEVRDRNRRLAALARARLVSVPGVEVIAPGSMNASMVALRIAGTPGPEARAGGEDPLAAALREAGVEVPVFGWPRESTATHRLLRVSTHLHTTQSDIDRLAAALRTSLALG